MGTFKIEGGIRLKGEVIPQGAKNEALQILCPVLLTSEKVRITNIPDIIDVNKLIALLGNLGVKIQKNGTGDYTFQADEVNIKYLETEAFKKEGGSLRGSIMIVGPLLARFGRRHEGVGDPGEFGDVRAHLRSAQRAVEADRERAGVADGVPEGLGRLA